MDTPQWLQKYRDHLESVIIKSQERFEIQLSYISAGALGLSLAFIKDIVQSVHLAKYKWLLYLGWGLLTATLVLNCVSHMIAAILYRRTMLDIDKKSDKYDSLKAEYRSKAITICNIISVGFLLFGISAIVLFVSINI